jgi:hypothetical protein
MLQVQAIATEMAQHNVDRREPAQGLELAQFHVRENPLRARLDDAIKPHTIAAGQNLV